MFQQPDAGQVHARRVRRDPAGMVRRARQCAHCAAWDMRCCCLLASAAGITPTRRSSSSSGRWGARARSCSACCRSSSADAGRARPRPADSVERGTREAAHRLCRRRHARRLPARQHLDPRVRRAATRSSRSTTGWRARRRCKDDYFPGIFDTNVIDGALYGVPWYVDTRLLFYRTDLLQQAGARRSRRPPGRRGSMRCCASRHAPAPDDYAILLPMSEWQTPVILALQLERAACCATTTGTATFAARRSASAFSFYLDLFRRRPGAARRRGAGRESLPRLRRRLLRVLHHRPVEHRRVPATLAAGVGRQVGDGADAGSRRDAPGRLDSRAAPAWRCFAARGTRTRRGG